MSAARIKEKLNSLKSNSRIDKNDFLNFVKTLSNLAQRIASEKKFPTYGHVVKEWIGAFQIIFDKPKVNDELKKYMNKLCSVVTEVYLKILQSIYQFDRNYIQEFYWHWKEILSFMEASKRASTFIRRISQLNVIVTHLRNAEQRCEQLAILNVLSLYTERVPLSQLNNCKEHFLDDNGHIFEKLIQLRQQSSTTSEHEFLHYINSMSDCILSFKSTKIVCEKLAIQYSIPEYEMWIDFNLKDKSIMLVTKSVIDDSDECMAIVAVPKLKEDLVNNEHFITVQGIWNISTIKDTDSVKRVNITFYFDIHVRNMIFESQVRNVFKIVAKSSTYSSYGESTLTDYQPVQMKVNRWLNNRSNIFAPHSDSEQDESSEPSISLLPSYAECKGLYETASSAGKCLIPRNAVGQQPYHDRNVNLMDVDHLDCDAGNNVHEEKQQFNNEMKIRPEENLMEYVNDGNENMLAKKKLPKQPIFEIIAQSSSDRIENIEKAVMPFIQQQLVYCQGSEASFCDGLSVPEAFSDNELENSHRNSIEKHHLVTSPSPDEGENPKDNEKTVTLSEEPIFKKIAKSSPDRIENIKKAVMPFVQRQLVDYQSSGASFCDNLSVQEDFSDNELEKSLKANCNGKDNLAGTDEHIEYMEYSNESFNKCSTSMQKMLTTLSPHEQMKLLIQIASNERNESNDNILENVSNDTNKLQGNEKHLLLSSSVPIVDENNVMAMDSENNPCQNVFNGISYISSPKPLPLNDVPLNYEMTRNQADAITNNLSQVISLDNTQTIQTEVPKIVIEDIGYEFANDGELQIASRFYIDNDGLNYLKSGNFKKLNSTQQKLKERQFRTIHEMINRGLETLHRNDKKISVIDPYALPKQKSSKSSNFAVPEQKKRKPVESVKPLVSTTRRKIRNILLLHDDDVTMKETISSKSRQQLNKLKNTNVIKTPKSLAAKFL